MSGVHDYLATQSPASVLCLGTSDHELPGLCRAWPVPAVALGDDDALTAQLGRRFDVVLVGRMSFPEHRTAIVHTAVHHLERDGHLVVMHTAAEGALDDTFRADDLQPMAQGPCGAAVATVFRRGPRFTVHDLLHEARARINRVTPAELLQQLQSEPSPLVLDTRTQTDRSRFGTIGGSIHVPRTVVEWHFDPANGYLHPAMTSFDRPVVVVCNSGYSSSLSAANLARIGFTDVADLIGGFEAWRVAGLPVEPPDHSHLDNP